MPEASTYVDDRGTTWARPTAEAYAQTCRALERLKLQIAGLLRNVGEPGTCKGCGAAIIWVEHRNGKRAPYTPEGLNHFADCPAAEKFRAQKGGK